MKRKVMDELRRTFRPEFLNRIDEVIVFHALSREHLTQIVEIEVGYLVKQMKERNVHLTFTDAAKAFLVEKGYDPDYGGRPLRRAIQRYVENPLSEEMLRGKFKEGDSVVVDAEGGEIRFRKEEMAGVKQ